MTDRPIIFSGPMVRALLDGRKTQTRRLATSPLRLAHAGDRLWVRETWKPVHSADPSRGARYRVDVGRDDTIWRPSIHMTRWASRLTLIVERVWQEPLQAISASDARAEGVDDDMIGRAVAEFDNPLPREPGVGAYAWLWASLHGRKSWDENPQIVAIAFSVRKGNIDGGRPA